MLELSFCFRHDAHFGVDDAEAVVQAGIGRIFLQRLIDRGYGLIDDFYFTGGIGRRRGGSGHPGCETGTGCFILMDERQTGEELACILADQGRQAVGLRGVFEDEINPRYADHQGACHKQG